MPQEQNLGVFPSHLPCEISEAIFGNFNGFSPRFSSTGNQSISIDFLSFSISFSRFSSVIFNQVLSILIYFNQFDLVKNRERKMRTNFFCTNFLNTARGPGHPGRIPGTSRIPLFETQGRQSFDGGHEVFGHHPFAWKTPTPPGGLRTQKLNLFAPFSCLKKCRNLLTSGR